MKRKTTKGKLLALVVLVGCGGSTADHLTDAGPDATVTDSEGGEPFIYETNDAGELVLIKLQGFSSDGGSDARDASSDAGDAGDATTGDTGPAGPMLGLCELCETDADCAAGVCAVANSTGEGATRCLPDCSTEQEIACGEPFGWRSEDHDPSNRLWRCYDHGACGPLDNDCAFRLGFGGSGSCVRTDYCEGWLEGT